MCHINGNIFAIAHMQVPIIKTLRTKHSNINKGKIDCIKRPRIIKAKPTIKKFICIIVSNSFIRNMFVSNSVQ